MRMHRARESLHIRQESYRTAVFFIEFLRILWYNHGQRTDAVRPSFFYPAPRDFFCNKRKINENTKIFAGIDAVARIYG